MSRRRMLWAAVTLAAAIAVMAVVHVVRSSVPATPDDIRTTIASTRPECRELLRDRLQAAILRTGAVSRRQVDTMAHMECIVSGPQYEATGG